MPIPVPPRHSSATHPRDVLRQIHERNRERITATLERQNREVKLQQLRTAKRKAPSLLQRLNALLHSCGM